MYSPATASNTFLMKLPPILLCSKRRGQCQLLQMMMMMEWGEKMGRNMGIRWLDRSCWHCLTWRSILESDHLKKIKQVYQNSRHWKCEQWWKQRKGGWD